MNTVVQISFNVVGEGLGICSGVDFLCEPSRQDLTRRHGFRVTGYINSGDSARVVSALKKAGVSGIALIGVNQFEA